MEYEATIFKPSFDEICFNRQNVLDRLGYKQAAASQDYIDLVERLYKDSERHIKAQCGYLVLDDDDVLFSDKGIFLKGIVFKTGEIIGAALRKMEKTAIFAATIGQEFDYWSKRTFEDVDPLAGYIIDIIGSEMAEALLVWLENKIIQAEKHYGNQCSRSYSPGYCGWDVAEQQKLFSFLPHNFCNIRLTESALMIPHKSVSGIIGIGKDIKRHTYPCNICTISSCYKKN